MEEEADGGFTCKPGSSSSFLQSMNCGDSGCGSSVAGSGSVAPSPRHLSIGGGRILIARGTSTGSEVKENVCGGCRACSSSGEPVKALKRLQQRSRRKMIKRTGSLELRGLKKRGHGNQKVSRSTSQGHVDASASGSAPHALWTPETSVPSSRRRRKMSAPSCCASCLKPTDSRDSSSPEHDSQVIGFKHRLSSKKICLS